MVVKEKIVRLRIQRYGGNMEHGGGLHFTVAAAPNTQLPQACLFYW